jgi:hypothetical protein
MKKINITGINKRLLSIILSTTLSLTTISYSQNKIVRRSNLDDYKEYISSINPDYKYKDLYIEHVGLINFDNLKDSKECNSKYDVNSDKLIDNLVNTIKNNSNHYYLKNKFSNQNCTYKTAFLLNNSKEDYEINFEKILSNVLKKIISTSSNNINEDICRMKSLVIILKTTDECVLGYYKNTENMIVLSINNIIDKNYNQQQIEQVLEHELNHLRQTSCHDKENTNDFMIPNLLFPYTPYYIESSAESALYNLKIDNNSNDYTSNDYTYPKQRKEESFLLLLGLFKDNISLNDYYDAIFDKDIDKFMNYLGVESNEDANTLYRIIRTSSAYVDTFNEPSELSIMNEHKKKETIGYAYRVDIFKQILENMINYTYEHKEFPLEENLVIFNIIRNICISDTYLSKKQIGSNVTYTYEESIVKDILKLNNKYKEFLCRYYNVDSNYINKYYNYINSITNEIINTSKNTKKNKEITKEAATILKKFPILKAALFSNNNFYGDSFNKYLKTNNLKEENYPKSPNLPYSGDYYQNDIFTKIIKEHKTKKYSKKNSKMK